MTVLLCNLKILFSSLFCCLIVNAKQGIVEGMKAGCTCIESWTNWQEQENMQKNKELFYHFLKRNSHVWQSPAWLERPTIYSKNYGW